MKRNVAVAAWFLLGLLALRERVAGQDIKKVQEPEYVGTFFLLDSATGNLIPLERQAVGQKIEVHFMGFGGASSSLEIRGERSPVRFSEGQKLEFIVLVPSQKADPHGLIHLFLLDPDDGVRRLETGRAGSMGRSAESGVGASALAFNASKYGESSFKITPAQFLPPGEYGFKGPGSDDGFLFGIDPDPKTQAARLERVVPFRTGESIPLGIVELLATIESVEITGWPKPEAVRAAETKPGEMTKLSLKFTYSNRAKKTWKCLYNVAVLDEGGAEVGSGERNARLGGGENSDTNGVSARMRTLDFPKAAKLRIRVSVHRD